MLEAKCVKCGVCYRGWALLNPRHQTCPKCGTKLTVTEGGRKAFEGYSPFDAERLSINPAAGASPHADEEKEERSQEKRD